jgi:hypothetical protein
MAALGICSNPNCELSYLRVQTEVLEELLAVVRARVNRERDFADLLPAFEIFKPFFQTNVSCASCGQESLRNSTRLDGDEQSRKLNDLVRIAAELRARGILEQVRGDTLSE